MRNENILYIIILIPYIFALILILIDSYFNSKKINSTNTELKIMKEKNKELINELQKLLTR